MIQIAQCTPTQNVPQILPHRRHRRCFLITHGNILLAIRHWNDLASWLLAAVYCLLWSVQFITATAHKQPKLTGINPWIFFFTLCFSWAKLVAAVWGWSGREGNARVARLNRFRVHWIPFDHKFTMEMAAMAHVTWHGCCRAQPSSPLTSHAIKEPTTAKLLYYILQGVCLLQGVFLWCYNSSAWLFALILVRGWYWSQILVGDTVGYIGQILCFLLDVSFRCNVGFSGWILWKHFSFSICKNSEKKFSQDPFFLKKNHAIVWMQDRLDDWSASWNGMCGMIGRAPHCVHAFNYEQKPHLQDDAGIPGCVGCESPYFSFTLCFASPLLQPYLLSAVLQLTQHSALLDYRFPVTYSIQGSGFKFPLWST